MNKLERPRYTQGPCQSSLFPFCCRHHPIDITRLTPSNRNGKSQFHRGRLTFRRLYTLSCQWIEHCSSYKFGLWVECILWVESDCQSTKETQVSIYALLCSLSISFIAAAKNDVSINHAPIAHTHYLSTVTHSLNAGAHLVKAPQQACHQE